MVAAVRPTGLVLPRPRISSPTRQPPTRQMGLPTTRRRRATSGSARGYVRVRMRVIVAAAAARPTCLFPPRPRHQQPHSVAAQPPLGRWGFWLPASGFRLPATAKAGRARRKGVGVRARSACMRARARAWCSPLCSRCARAALVLRSRCARAALALRSRCATHTPASGEPSPWAVHDGGGGSPSSSPPSCCHCAVIIHANPRARSLALARALSLARADALAMLALRSHSRPCLVAPQRFARLSAPAFARAALSLCFPRAAVPQRPLLAFFSFRRLTRHLQQRRASGLLPSTTARGC